MTSRSKKKWFIKVRGSYLPNNTKGWLTYIPYTCYLVGVLVYVMKSDHDFWISLFIVVPNWVAAAAVMNWVASRTS